MSASFHAAPFPPKCAPMRRIDLQIVWWRRRAQALAPARPAAVPNPGFSPDGDPRTGTQDQRPPDTLLPRAAPWSHALGSSLLSRSGAGKHTRGRFDQPTPPASSRRSMVVRPRTGASARSFPRRSEDRCYGGWTVDRGRAPNRCEPTLTKLSAHERSREGARPFTRVAAPAGGPGSPGGAPPARHTPRSRRSADPGAGIPRA